jgi:hypothetical protein
VRAFYAPQAGEGNQILQDDTSTSVETIHGHSAERQRFAGQLCDEVIWPLLLRYGLFEWGTLTKIAKELGVHRSTVCRHRQRIFRAMVGL